MNGHDKARFPHWSRPILPSAPVKSRQSHNTGGTCSPLTCHVVNVVAVATLDVTNGYQGTPMALKVLAIKYSNYACVNIIKVTCVFQYKRALPLLCAVNGMAFPYRRLEAMWCPESC